MGVPIKPETARAMTDMLVKSLVNETSLALVPGYKIAGKTGTAEIPVEGVYGTDQTNASFVGWGPADNPAISRVRLDRASQKISLGFCDSSASFQRNHQRTGSLFGYSARSGARYYGGKRRIDMITLNDIIFALTGVVMPENGIIITEAVIDSRKAIPGSLFVALPGERSDGHNFINFAFEKGAALALVQQDLGSEFRVLDLRNATNGQKFSIPQTPFCIRVDDSLKSLQEIARYWRQKLSTRVIAITGSVGKSSTKELSNGSLKPKIPYIQEPRQLQQ